MNLESNKENILANLLIKTFSKNSFIFYPFCPLCKRKFEIGKFVLEYHEINGKKIERIKLQISLFIIKHLIFDHNFEEVKNLLFSITNCLNEIPILNEEFLFYKRKKLERKAIKISIKKEEKENRKIILFPIEECFDILSIGNNSNDIRFIKIVGIVGYKRFKKYIVLSKNEFEFAKKMKDKYWIYLFYNIQSDNPYFVKFQNPIESMDWKISIKEKSIKIPHRDRIITKIEQYLFFPKNIDKIIEEVKSSFKKEKFRRSILEEEKTIEKLIERDIFEKKSIRNSYKRRKKRREKSNNCTSWETL